MTNEEAIAELEERYMSMSMCAITDECKRANEALDLAISALERDRWISVEERLPEEPGLYIVFLLAPIDEYRKELSHVTEMYFDKAEMLWVDDTEQYNALLPQSDERYCVTHWMPLPEPPKEET